MRMSSSSGGHEMARTNAHHQQLDVRTFAGMVKVRAFEQDVTLRELAVEVGLRPGTLRGRLSKCRGKRALQPWQVTRIALRLRMDVRELHRLAAAHEGWDIL